MRSRRKWFSVFWSFVRMTEKYSLNTDWSRSFRCSTGKRREKRNSAETSLTVLMTSWKNFTLTMKHSPDTSGVAW